jgi:hypothetical protein
VYRLIQRPLAPAELRAGRSLLFEDISVIVLLLRDLAPRVPEILPALLVLDETLPIFEQDGGHRGIYHLAGTLTWAKPSTQEGREPFEALPL